MSNRSTWVRKNTRRLDIYLSFGLYSAAAMPPLALAVLALAADSRPDGPAAGFGGPLVIGLVASLPYMAAAIVVVHRSLRVLRNGASVSVVRPPNWPLLGWFAATVVCALLATAYLQGFFGLIVIATGLSAVSPALGLRQILVLTTAATTGLVAFIGDEPQILAAVAVSSFVMAFAVVGGFWVTAWMLRVMIELEQSRDTAARLAIAEERLRFSRDLHDVFGRTLSVVAVKSELAAGLADRGRASDAAQQIREVHRLAEQAGKDVREVVRGYREVSLSNELSGARAILEAADIGCEIDPLPADLPAATSAALGWVVRESVTNVLRHSAATRVLIGIQRDGDAVELTVENDGVRATSADHVAAGSGLAGLRERLADVGGELSAGRHGEEFRVIARARAGAGRQRRPAAARPDKPQALPAQRVVTG